MDYFYYHTIMVHHLISYVSVSLMVSTHHVAGLMSQTPESR